MTMFKIYLKKKDYPIKTEKCEYILVLYKDEF